MSWEKEKIKELEKEIERLQAEKQKLHEKYKAMKRACVESGASRLHENNHLRKIADKIIYNFYNPFDEGKSWREQLQPYIEELKQTLTGEE
jgi:predicted RNase H-like nuclease (RuvC/YqgF family)